MTVLDGGMNSLLADTVFSVMVKVLPEEKRSDDQQLWQLLFTLHLQKKRELNSG